MTGRKKSNITISLLIVIVCILIVMILFFNINSIENKTLLSFIIGAVISFGVNAGYFLISEIFLIKDEEIKELYEKLRYINIDKNSIVIFKYIDANAFYGYLDRARKEANKNVYLTNYSIIPYKSENKNSYFKKELTYCNSLYRKNHEAKIKRIITIHNQEKLTLYRNIIKKMINNDVRNFNMAYLHINNFAETDYLHGVIGIQIIDDEVFIMDPRIARIEQDRPPILIQNKQIADFFNEYHTKLWEEIKNSDDPKERGCILYCGDYGKEKNKSIYENDIIWNTIKNQMQEN